MASPVLIQVDDRQGSGYLVAFLKQLGLKAELTRLEFGDVVLIGPEHGPGKAPWTVGVEIKRIPDLINCIHDRRFSGHQLPGLLASYDAVFLLIEGRWRSTQSGVLEREVFKKGRKRGVWVEEGIMARDVESWITTHELRAGVKFRYAEGPRDTARKILALRAWVEKGWDAHHSHLAMYSTAVPPDGRILFTQPSPARQLANLLPGVGFEKSKAVAKVLRSPEEIVLATEEEWRKVPGIGKTLAERIRAWITERK